MPSSTPKQRRFMAAVAHDPAFADKVRVPVAVGLEFNRADEGRLRITTPGGAVASGGYAAKRKR